MILGDLDRGLSPLIFVKPLLRGLFVIEKPLLLGKHFNLGALILRQLVEVALKGIKFFYENMMEPESGY